MSFLKYSLTQNKTKNKKQTIVHRKEKKDSLLANHFPKIYYIKEERASAFTSKGSITLEAAIAVPLFLFAMLCLVYLLELIAIQTSVRNALYSAGREAAREAYISTAAVTQRVEQRVENDIEREVDCSASYVNENTGVFNLSVKYEVDIPIPIFMIPSITYEETMRIKGWNGYEPGAEESGETRMVYITDTGLVYHEDKDCTYLDLSISEVDKEQVEDMRNQSGGKYHECKSCKYDEMYQSTVYVTDYGTKYHVSLECSRLKRTVYAVPYNEVYGLGGCSKCAE